MKFETKIYCNKVTFKNVKSTCTYKVKERKGDRCLDGYIDDGF